MPCTKTLTALLAAASLTACAQTNGPEKSNGGSAETPAPGASVNHDPVKTPRAAQKGTALPPPELANGRYWLKNGPSALYNEAGEQQRILRNPGPYRIYARDGDLAKISHVNNHWVRFEDLSTETPNPLAWMNTAPPHRPITQFPDALEEEAKRRGINVKDPKKD